MFSLFRFILKSLRHYWRINVAVGLATAVGAAVLAGALLVGASMRGSLAALTLERLGRIDAALRPGGFFREKLAEAFPGACPAILMDGSVVHATSGARAGKAQVIGLTPAFWDFEEAGKAAAGRATGAGGTPTALTSKAYAETIGDGFTAVLNEPLAHELNAKEGDEVLLRVQKPSPIPREAFLGDRDKYVATFRLRVARVIPAAGLGRFTLRLSQYQPLNIYVPLAALQTRLETPGRVNVLLAPKPGADLQDILKKRVTLEDMGLRLRATSTTLSLESDRIFLQNDEIRPLLEAPSPPAVSFLPVFSYLANTLRVGGREIPYSTVAALEVKSGADPLKDVNDGIVLNEWAANGLKARKGDRLTMSYFVEAPGGGLRETSASLPVAGVVAMNDPRVSTGLVPEFPGIAKAETIGDWDPPFPVDLKRVRPMDEDYWRDYRAAPKAFVSLETGWALWGRRFGSATSILISGLSSEAAERAVMARIDPAKEGFVWQLVKEQGLAASSGSTDFGGLFIGFSFFLLASAAMLILMLYRLGVEGRARELGLLRAVGYSPRRARRLLMFEGAVVAAAGAIVGAGLAVAYAAVLTYGLRVWWVSSIGAPILRLRVDAASLAEGAAGGWLIAMAAIWTASVKLARVSPRALLAGRVGDEGLRRRKWLFVVTGACAFFASAAFAATAPSLSAAQQAMGFFGSGALLLASALAFFAAWLGWAPARAPGRLTVTRLGLGASRRHPGRSLLVTGLMACAAFLIVAVGANRKTAVSSRDKSSGTGGFALMGESALPIFGQVEKTAGSDAKVFPMRLRPGDDASCLNLYHVARPRVVGVSDEFIARGGFAFSGNLAKSLGSGEEERENPWLLLKSKDWTRTIPAIGDYNTVVWLLHSGLGKSLEVDGQPMVFVALLEGSVLQGEILISDENFRKLYPDESGWRLFFIETPADKERAVAQRLESQLEDYGFDATDTAAKLADLMAVENTYLSAFQNLGGLGLLLGTLGLALTLLRNLMERRAEFALMRAMGYRFRALLWLAVVENLLLLVVGLACGAVCALVAVAPALKERSGQAPWLSLSLTLAAVFVCGLAAILLSAAAALRAPALKTLTEE